MTEIPEHLRRRRILEGTDTSDGDTTYRIQLKKNEGHPNVWIWRIVDQRGTEMKTGAKQGREQALEKAEGVLAELDLYEWHDA